MREIEASGNEWSECKGGGQKPGIMDTFLLKKQHRDWSADKIGSCKPT
jgi:hypothetical protein